MRGDQAQILVTISCLVCLKATEQVSDEAGGPNIPPGKPSAPIPEPQSTQSVPGVAGSRSSEPNIQGAVKNIPRKVKSKKTVAKERIKYYKDLENEMYKVFHAHIMLSN